MKAVRIHQYGKATELKYEDAPMPALGATDVLVKTVATSVNPVDWKIREGYLKTMINYTMPLILGLDVSGVVEAVGKDVSRFKVGDAVYSRPATNRNGTYAEFVAINEKEISRKPNTISHVEAASLPLVGITAWEGLITHAKLSAGQKVLIHGGSGGVGTLAIQLAKSKGAFVITTTSSKNEALVKALGADEVIDYKTQAFETLVKNIDVVFDTIGGKTQELSWQVLKEGGILVSTVGQPSEALATKFKARGVFFFIGPNAEILDNLAKLVEAGKIRPVIGAEFALADIAKAHALSESGRAIGKIALYVGQP